jgi:hypothetical protein
MLLQKEDGQRKDGEKTGRETKIYVKTMMQVHAKSGNLLIWRRT